MWSGAGANDWLTYRNCNQNGLCSNIPMHVKILGDSYRTGPMNSLIIPQVMHITAHDYDIIRGPC
jgi:hypothetical protein